MTQGPTELVEQMKSEPVLVADQEPFVEVWETDWREIIATIESQQRLIERKDAALKRILEIDGPYCDSCHSSEICAAFKIAKDALTPSKDEPNA